MTKVRVLTAFGFGVLAFCFSSIAAHAYGNQSEVIINTEPQLTSESTPEPEAEVKPEEDIEEENTLTTPLGQLGKEVHDEIVSLHGLVEGYYDRGECMQEDAIKDRTDRVEKLNISHADFTERINSLQVNVDSGIANEIGQTALKEAKPYVTLINEQVDAHNQLLQSYKIQCNIDALEVFNADSVTKPIQVIDVKVDDYDLESVEFYYEASKPNTCRYDLNRLSAGSTRLGVDTLDLWTSYTEPVPMSGNKSYIMTKNCGDMQQI